MQHHARIEPLLDEAGKPTVFVPLCKSIIATRLKLGEMFGSLCSDPGSEMLLDIYWRESQGLKTSLTCLWRATRASEMTARRCLAVMEEQEIVERMPDALDKRCINVRLTPAGREKIDICFRTLLAGYAETCRDCARNCEDGPLPQGGCPWAAVLYCMATGGFPGASGGPHSDESPG